MVICNTNRDQWKTLPESKSRIKKKSNKVNFLPTPDTIIVNSFQDKLISSEIVSTVNNAKEALLTCSLDRTKNLAGIQSVNPEGYLTQLDGMDTNNQEIQDLKKLRGLLRSLINSNPNQPMSWLAASRIEEKDSTIKGAKELMHEACIKCPDSEDIWIEAARLESYEKSKQILKKATNQLPKSVKLWIAAANKETTNEAKAKILKQALEYNPESVKLWKEIISISSDIDAKKYLEKSVICAPHSLELWLALAKLEPYKEARKTLINARKQLPLEPTIWISAAKLEEAQGNNDNVGELIKRGIKYLLNSGVEINRGDWANEIILAEKSNSYLTAKAIIKHLMNVGVDSEQKLTIWIKDLYLLQESQCIESFRYLYNLALEIYPESKELWKNIYILEKRIGDRDQIKVTLNQACKNCNSARFWVDYMRLLPASEVFDSFKSAIAKHDKKLIIYLIAYQILFKSSNLSDAEEVLKLGKTNCYCPKIIRKLIEFYRTVNNINNAKEIALKGIQDFPNDKNIYIKFAGLCNNEEARDIIVNACNKLPECGKLWILLARIEETDNNDLKARYILEKGRNASNDINVLYESIEYEIRKINYKAAELILNKGLQEFSSDGRLWSYAISLCDSKNKKTRTAEALERCSEDPYLLLAIARLFQSERKFEKARGWYEKALAKGSWLGDIWIYYYSMEEKLKEAEKKENILLRCSELEIRKGDLWKKHKTTESNQQIILNSSSSII